MVINIKRKMADIRDFKRKIVEMANEVGQVMTSE